MSTAYQISHAELLLLLGMLGLPRPPALGAAAGLPAGLLPGALAAAAGSLAARDLLQPGPQPSSRPAPHAGLAELVRAVALADGLLIVAGGPTPRVGHISRHQRTLVLHTSPQPDVHRLELLADPAGVAERAAALIAPLAAAEPLADGPLAVDGEALVGALDALQTGGQSAALAALHAGGMGVSAACSFLAAAGPTPARYAIAALRDLRGGQPAARGALVVAGPRTAWWAAPPSADAARLELRPLGAAGLRARVAELGAWMCEAA